MPPNTSTQSTILSLPLIAMATVARNVEYRYFVFSLIFFVAFEVPYNNAYLAKISGKPVYLVQVTWYFGWLPLSALQTLVVQAP